MKTVLFATDHIPPDPKALDYALALCKRLAARLEVLQILQSPADGTRSRRLHRTAKQGADRTMDTVRSDRPPAEDHATESNADVPFQFETVDQLQRLYSDHPSTHIDYRFEIAHGTAGAAIEQYVRSHRDIVLTVFDPRSERYFAAAPGKTDRPVRKKAMPRLAVPLVLVKKT
jgi:hypothetical protein